jgi:hypothetical protein
MPGMARALDHSGILPFARSSETARGVTTMHCLGTALPPADRAFLLEVQRQGLRYFLENQAANGLMLDRQHNHGPRRVHGLCSTAATGMGFIALALAAAPPYRLLPWSTAVARVRAGLRAALDQLPHDEGVVPHFVHSATGEVHGFDQLSTVETAWLLAGALWAAAFLEDAETERLAGRLYERVDWHYWTAPGRCGEDGLLRHGKGRDGEFLTCSWDRLNGETAFMYVLAAGAADGRAVARTTWEALGAFYGSVAGLRFNNSDLGLFVFQYGLDLLDLRNCRPPGAPDLWSEAGTAAQANRLACREASETYATYRRFWGLSAGDGPGARPGEDVYRGYTPVGPVDGTAHLTAALASVAHEPAAVLENLREALADRGLPVRGRYGFSNVNVDRQWVSRDVVGIDVGAAVLALDNVLAEERVRRVFQGLPCVRRGQERFGFVPDREQDAEPALRQAS